MDDDAVFDTRLDDSRLDTETPSAGHRPVESHRKIWIPMALAVVVMLAFALYGSSWVQSFLLSGKLKSLGVDIAPLSAGGVKVTARQTNITSQELKRIAQIPDVMHLDLFGCEAISAEGFLSLESMTSLQKLNLSGTQINDLRPLRPCSQLEALALDRSALENPSLKVLSDKASLRLLSANDTSMNDDSLRSLGPAPNLAALYVARTQVTGEILFLLSGFPKLQTLNLSGTKLTNSDLVSHKWPQVAGLRQLFLNDLPITDEGLAELRVTVEEKLPALSSLGLANTKISSASLKVLATLPQLETIRLSGTPIPREAIEKLRLEMPNTYIEGN